MIPLHRISRSHSDSPQNSVANDMNDLIHSNNSSSSNTIECSSSYSSSFDGGHPDEDDDGDNPNQKKKKKPKLILLRSKLSSLLTKPHGHVCILVTTILISLFGIQKMMMGTPPPPPFLWASTTFATLGSFRTTTTTTPTTTTTGRFFRRNGSSSSGTSCPIPQWKYPNCRPYIRSSTSEPPPPPLTSQHWHELRTKYQQVVGDEASSLDPSWATVSTTTTTSSSSTNNTATQNNDNNNNGFLVPIEIRTSPGKGRGVFVTKHIRAGQQLWDNRYSARFPDECSVRRFLASISEEDACSVIAWGSVNDFFSGQGQQFQIDLDEGVYMNEGEPEKGSKNENNVLTRFITTTTTASSSSVQQQPQPQEEENIRRERIGSFDAASRKKKILEEEYAQRRIPGNFGLFAKKDMEPGTELLFDYSDVHVYLSLFWYEKLCIKARGFWGWMTMY